MSTISSLNITIISNVTVSSARKDASVSISTWILLVLAAVISVLNISCLIVLAKEKKLKAKRFNMLTICLSVSDTTTGLLASALSFHTIHFRMTGNGLPPFCFMTVSLTSTTILFSLLQTLWICLERAIATFPTAINPCRNISIVAMTVVLFLVCSSFVIPVCLAYGDVWSESCSVDVIFGKNRTVVLQIIQPVYLLTVIAIVTIYIAVIFRIYKSWRRIHPAPGQRVAIRRQGHIDLQTITTVQSGDPTSLNISPHQEAGQDTTTASTYPNLQHQISNTGLQRIWKMTVTSGLLILVMLFSVLPKVILGLVVVRHPFNVNLLTALAISDLFLFLNPLIDPIIYVLRIRSFRDRLMCRSSS